ncbi:TolB family protein [Sorangium cellulosum]|uniref:TolB family protein n=1 Tax=Sorangium cellulosum TaxID=56 RepID=UPI000CF4A832|nr:PD40 domain-containing protein [Sorangium cellulosum]
MSWGLALALGGAACEDQQVIIGTLAPEPPVYAPERPRFSAPEKVGALSDDVARDEDPTLTGDLLEIHFMSERGGSQDIWISRRADLDAPWEPPSVEVAAELNTDVNEDTPAISNDGLRLWFFRNSDPQAGIWMSERASRDDPWGAPVYVDALNPGHDGGTQAMNAHVDLPELRAVVGLNGPETQGWDLAIASRDSPDDPWGEFVPIAELNDEGEQLAPFLFDDGRQLLFRSGDDLFWARRQTTDEPFEAPEPLEELNAPDARENDPYLSPDGSVVFFSSERSGGSDIYEARRVAP